MENFLTVGWREWVSLPELGIHRVKTKVDTGARTSALHAFDLHPFKENDVQRIRFHIHPKQRDRQKQLICVANVADKRTVTNSGGQREDRWVISTLLSIGTHSWPIELTLTNRDEMKFRMLLGRTALNNHALVNSSASYLVGKKRITRRQDKLPN